MGAARSLEPGWFQRFRMLEKQTSSQLHSRSDAARGILEGLSPHPSDAEIHQWRSRKQKAIHNSKIAEQLSKKSPSGNLLPFVSTQGFAQTGRLNREVSAPDFRPHSSNASSALASVARSKSTSALRLPPV